MDPIENIPQINSQIEQFIGHWFWLILMFIVLIFGKQALINFVAGLRFYLNKDFNELDVIWVFERIARITKIGMTKTTMIFYDKGTKMTIPNHELESLRMEKALPMADLTQLPTDEDPDGGLYKEGEEPSNKEMQDGLVE